MNLPPLSVITELGEKAYVATCPELDIVSQGDTAADAESNLREAVELFLESASSAEITERLARKVEIHPLVLGLAH